MHGAVSRAFRETCDAEALRASIRDICAGRENIKHCVEMIPWQVTETLLEEAHRTGYRFLFLIRRDRAGRLLSMEYAQRTQVWGPNHVDKVAQDAEAFRKPLDVAALITHETRCVTRLNSAWEVLDGRLGAEPALIAYEDVYGADARHAADRVGAALARLHLAGTAGADADLVEELCGRGDQNTRNRYARFKGVDELRAAVASMEGFAFNLATAPGSAP